MELTAPSRPRTRLRAPAALLMSGGWLALIAACDAPARPTRQPPPSTPVQPRAQPLIVGTDDRSELHEGGLFDTDPTWMHLGRSVPALVGSGKLVKEGSQWQLTTLPGLNFCPGERYREQKEAAECTAALVGDDLILTAHHCIDDPTMGGDLLPHRKVVFGFVLSIPSAVTQGRTTFNDDEVYTPVSVVAHGIGGGQDWAVVRLDRRVHARYKRLQIADYEPTFSTNPAMATQVYLVGYGLGKPGKISREGFTVLAGHPSFRAVIEAFPANSGSPLIDKATHKIVGVLSSGAQDTVWDEGAQCFRHFVCPPDVLCNYVFQRTSLFRDLVAQPAVSCSGVCGRTPDFGGCWCDDACTQFGDCCSDKAEVCGSGDPPCLNRCGSFQSGAACQCDALCANYGDCCSKFFDTCGILEPF
jgi:V8-like Glu-specific endopeptidase